MRSPQSPAARTAIDPEFQRRTVAKLRASLPVADLMEWLLAERPQADFAEIMGLLKGVYEAGFRILPVGTETRSYSVGERQLQACPQRVEG